MRTSIKYFTTVSPVATTKRRLRFRELMCTCFARSSVENGCAKWPSSQSCAFNTSASW